jgi:hypothetical protein
MPHADLGHSLADCRISASLALILNFDKPWFRPQEGLGVSIDRLHSGNGVAIGVDAYLAWKDRSEKRYSIASTIGLIIEGVATQQEFLQQLPVSYPPLTLHGRVPSLYRDFAQCQAIFLMDRLGCLQPTPGGGQSFEAIQATVDSLLNER